MQIMLDKGGASALCSFDTKGQTPMHAAASQGHDDLLELILKHSEGITALTRHDLKNRLPLDRARPGSRAHMLLQSKMPLSQLQGAF